jgi:SAM-dependent methyltransferase
VAAVGEQFSYVGSELEIFAKATRWKSYFSAVIRPHLGDEVLEVGAGLGATTRILCKKPHRRWVCLEPDAQLLTQLQAVLAAGELPACCQSRLGTLADLAPDDRYDAIVYLDVLEHISDDRAELASAAAHLKDGGKLVVLSPAHQWLFTPFDRAIGHCRRYSRRTMRDAVPSSLRCIHLWYLDSVGILASLGNRLFLNSGMPTPRQLWVWDKLMVPVSRLLDPLLFHNLGKSILGIWQKKGS